MIDARFVPLKSWPGERTPASRRQKAQFRATYAKTLELLEAELVHLRAKEIVIQAPFRLDQIRNDGWPRSSAAPNDVGVILSFETRTGPLAFPCDRFQTFDDNMRAIALSLQALRAVDRYGVTRKAEQYTGWKKLPPPSDQPFSFTAAVLAEWIRKRGISRMDGEIEAVEAQLLEQGAAAGPCCQLGRLPDGRFCSCTLGQDAKKSAAEWEKLRPRKQRREDQVDDVLRNLLPDGVVEC